MTEHWNSPRVTCRPALPSDRADVLEFTKFIWDGHDYIKYVWDEWFADPNGILVSAEFGGHCVGFAKISLSAPGQWWFQGFRVDPQYQGLKIGSHIHEYLDQWWLENGDGAARLMTSSQRVKVHHLCAKLGYAKILEVTGLVAEPLDEPSEAFEPVKDSEIVEALEFALTSPALSNGLLDLGWETLQPTTAILKNIADEGMAFWWRGRDGLLLAWDKQDEEGKVLGVSLPACPLESLTELLLDARRLCARQERINLFWITALNPAVLSAAEAAGFKNAWDHPNFIFEKRHPARP